MMKNAFYFTSKVLFVLINFEIKLIFLIKPFFLNTKKSKQKFKYLENDKSF